MKMGDLWWMMFDFGAAAILIVAFIMGNSK